MPFSIFLDYQYYQEHTLRFPIIPFLWDFGFQDDWGHPFDLIPQLNLLFSSITSEDLDALDSLRVQIYYINSPISHHERHIA
jgi:hypothetical protein